jgi:CRISPR-associated endonuclease/helicase Cas3
MIEGHAWGTILNLADPWGKLDNGASHHLAHHCADVAACFLAIVSLPVFRAGLDRAAGRRLSDVDVARLVALVFLHDVGKLHPGFQAKGWPPGIWTAPVFGHVREGLEIFLAQDAAQGLPAAKSLHIEHLETWGVSAGLLRAVISHHGRPAPAPSSLGHVKTYWKKVGAYDPNEAAVTLGDAVKSWLPSAFSDDAAQLPDTPRFEHLMCGLTALADWIGSDAERFKFAGALDPDYWQVATRQAVVVVAAIGLDASKQRAARQTAATFREVSRFDTPNLHQQLVGETDLKARLVILEAETGSGKTEAALWRYIQLFEAGHVDGLYFAVPTRAAAAQLHRRVDQAAKRLFGQADPQVVLAVPGYMRAGEAEGCKLPHWRVLWDDDGDAEKIAARWAAEHSTRYLAAQIAVGTVDQAMLGALKVKHAHMRASSMARSLLVIDEVHASDRFMTAIQKRLLDEHLAIGGFAMLMSATLGSSARTSWLGGRLPAPETFDVAVARPYPAVWTNLSPAAPRSPDEAAPRQKAVKMELLTTMAPEETAAVALSAARAGARVLVIRNTVKRAIETLQALEKLAEPSDAKLLFRVATNDVATLHHSRFSGSDRRLLDKAAEAALKPDPMRASIGLVIIGTQTLEQSLDIDADFLITDLSPIDVLLQRIGRLHRHILPRPAGFEAPRCIVMSPELGLERLLAPAFDNGLGAWKEDGALAGVYRDLCVIELTSRLVVRHAVWSIPAMNRLLVESATHAEPIRALVIELGADWQRYNEDVLGSELAKAGAARGIMIDRGAPFESCDFPDDAEERIRTRLGAEGARVQFTTPLPVSPFDQAPITEIVLPAHMSGGIGSDHMVTVSARSAEGFEFNVGARSFRYGRFGVATKI